MEPLKLMVWHIDLILDGNRNGPSALPPEPEQDGIAANEQIRQNDFHGRVGGLRLDMQWICQIA